MLDRILGNFCEWLLYVFRSDKCNFTAWGIYKFMKNLKILSILWNPVCFGASKCVSARASLAPWNDFQSHQLCPPLLCTPKTVSIEFLFIKKNFFFVNLL
jgi:hypothetical protein